MIAHITGRLIEKTPEHVVVDVNGVGYEVIIPLSTFYRLGGPGTDAALKVYTHVRDDAIQLYGFLTAEEKAAFALLIGVSGVGPRLARNILSGIEVGDLAAAISGADRARLNSVPGVGAKSAERLILELKDKVADLHAASEGPDEPSASHGTDEAADVVSALENLGYRKPKAEAAVKQAGRKGGGNGADEGFEALFKRALGLLSKA